MKGKIINYQTINFLILKLFGRNCLFKRIEKFDSITSIAENETDISYQAFHLDYPAKYTKSIELIEFTKVAYSFPIQLGQVLSETNNSKNTDISSFLYGNINLLSYILIGFLLLFFFSFAFLKQLFPSLSLVEKSKLILSKLLFNNYTQLRAFSSKIALIFLFFNLFLFILMNLLTNFIKTNAVIVNTDELIDSNEKLLNTPKVLFIYTSFFEKFSYLPKSSLLFKLAEKLKENNQYLTEAYNWTKTLQIVYKGESSSLFFLMDRISCFTFLAWCSETTKNPIVFMNPTNY